MKNSKIIVTGGLVWVLLSVVIFVVVLATDENDSVNQPRVYPPLSKAEYLPASGPDNNSTKTTVHIEGTTDDDAKTQVKVVPK